MTQIINFFKRRDDTNLIAISNSFEANSNKKLSNLFNFLFFFSTQRPYLKIVKFQNLKKKILKRYFIALTLRKRSQLNFLKYFNFYLYFFDKYYTKKLKYNIRFNSFIYYLDNPDLYFRNRKLVLNTQVKVINVPLLYNPTFIKII